MKRVNLKFRMMPQCENIICGLNNKFFNRLLLLGLAVITMSSVWGQSSTVTYTVTSKTAVSTTGTAPTGSSASYSQTYTATASQATAGNSMTLSLTKFSGTVSKIVFSLHSNSKQGSGNISYSVDGGTEVFLVGTSSTSAITFNKWGDNTSYGSSYRDVTFSGLSIKPKSSLTIYIRCVSKNSIFFESAALTYTATASGYDITYECNGATSGCPSDATGQTALPNPLPDAPVKDGNTFGGWFTNSGLTTAAVAGASISANTTLYAKWNPIHTVKVQATSSWSNTISAWVFPVGSDGSWATVTEEGFWYKFSVPDGYKFIIANGTGWADKSAESAAITADGCYWAAASTLTTLDCSSTTYYIKHPWNGSDWTWQAMSGTGDTRTFTGQWGNNGVNINLAAGNDNKLAKWIEAASITKPAGLTVGTSVVFTYTISTGAVTVSVPVTSVSLDKSTMSLKTTATGTLTATVLPSAASQTVNWTSSDETVATVSNGTVTAKKAGTATITATSTSDNTKKATCTVTVTDPVVTASANDGDLGSVSVTGNVITATPGGCVTYANDAYSVTGGTVASVVKNNNTFTVTASTDCSITINFAKQTVDTYKDNLHENEDIVMCGDNYTIPHYDSAAKGSECEGEHYYFAGWTSSTYSTGKAKTTDDPNFFSATGTKTATGATYYAVWAAEQ